MRHLSVAEMALDLSVSKAWVSMRLGLLGGCCRGHAADILGVQATASADLIFQADLNNIGIL